jgi:hypothetical protein
MIEQYIKELDDSTFYVEGVDYLHPDYEKYMYRWQKARDIIEGESEIKKPGKAESYLPRLPGQASTYEGNQEYTSFLQYAQLYNATGRTVDAYRGLLNRKLPHVKLPDSVKDLVNSFTIKGESMHTFIEQLEVEVITTNRVGVFVDHPYKDPDVFLSQYDVKRMNMHPYATLYTAESIINWEEKRINNRIVTTLVVLKEVDIVRLTSFTPEEIITYRVLELDEEGYYRQIIIQPQYETVGLQKLKREMNVIKAIVYPMQNGKKMDFIPFYPITAQGITWELNKSVIEDLINVNISHYRTTAIYEKALIWTASPTAVFSGLPEDVDTISIGSSKAVIVAPGGMAKYLEYEGAGLSSLENALKMKEQLMVVLGAKILSNEGRGVESGEAALIHRAGEQGILADIATTVGGAIEKLIRIICDWRGVSYNDSDILVEINKDYTPLIIDANTIVALGKEVNDGRLSYESYVGAMQRGEIIPATRTASEELDLIKQSFEPVTLASKTTLRYLDKKNRPEEVVIEEEEDAVTEGERQ